MVYLQRINSLLISNLLFYQNNPNNVRILIIILELIYTTYNSITPFIKNYLKEFLNLGIESNNTYLANTYLQKYQIKNLNSKVEGIIVDKA